MSGYPNLCRYIQVYYDNSQRNGRRNLNKANEKEASQSGARPTAFQVEALEMGMQLRKTALEKMGLNAGNEERYKQYKTNCSARRDGTETLLEST